MRSERAPKNRNFSVKIFQKVPKNAFYGLFFQNFAYGAENLPKIGTKQCFGRAGKINLVEFLPRQSPAFPKIVEDGTAIDLPWMWMRYADRPLSTTTNLEQYTDVRKCAMRGYKKWIVKYPKYNWNDSAANLYVARARWLPTSTSHAYYGIALQCATDLSTLYDIKLTAYEKQVQSDKFCKHFPISLGFSDIIKSTQRIAW